MSHKNDKNPFEIRVMVGVPSTHAGTMTVIIDLSDPAFAPAVRSAAARLNSLQRKSKRGGRSATIK